MNNLILLSEKLRLFQKKVNERKDLFVHRDNLFNKEIGKILSELGELEIILLRIVSEASNNDKVSELKLDIKSLHIFGFIFIESVIYIFRVFFPEARNIEFQSIGKFLNSVEKQKGNQQGNFRDFLDQKLGNIQCLNDALRKFRGLVSHEKRSTTEWTITDSLYPMSGSKIVNVPWSEDKEFQEQSSLSPTQFIGLITKEVGEIVDYLEEIIDAEK